MTSQKRTKPRARSEVFFNFIGGKWGLARSGEFFEDINPADTSDVIGQFPASVRTARPGRRRDHFINAVGL